jgi:hypothetical protein
MHWTGRKREIAWLSRVEGQQRKTIEGWEVKGLETQKGVAQRKVADCARLGPRL